MFIDTTFKCTVVPVDDVRKFQGIAAIEMFEDAETMFQSLAGAYVDSDGDEVGYLLVKCDHFNRTESVRIKMMLLC